MTLAEKANGKWYSILCQLGVEPMYLTGKHVPCPACGGRDRFRFDDKEGRGTHYCSSCGAGDGFSLLEKITGEEFSEVAKMVESVIGRAEYQEPQKKQDPTRRLRGIARSIRPAAENNPVATYLRSRCVSPTPATKEHTSMRYYENGKLAGSYPAMVCLVQDNDGNPVTYHVTYINQDGTGKADVPAAKKVISELGTNGYHIRLDKPLGNHLGVAEGIETSLSGKEICQIPVWATINTNGMKAFEPPEWVRYLTIFADNDENFDGQAAAYHLANRLIKSGRNIKVRVLVPKKAGDWNDVLIREMAEWMVD